MIGPLEIVGDDDSLVCDDDGYCALPDANPAPLTSDQARGLRR